MTMKPEFGKLCKERRHEIFPELLYFSYSTQFGTRTIKCNFEKTILYKDNLEIIEEIKTPGPRYWKSFHHILEFLDAPNWEPEYSTDEIFFGGSEWRFEYKFGDMKCLSSGKNVSPDPNDTKLDLLSFSLDALFKRKHFIDLFRTLY